MTISKNQSSHQRKISIIGLGYVGLPVAVAFAKSAPTIGFDINVERLEELRQGIDRTLEVSTEELSSAHINFTNDIEVLKKADFHIVAVPTPVDDANQPDLTPVIKASETVAKALRKGTIVVFESTVYPGVTEDVCVPILEKISGLKCGIDFTVGYSPERISPGDKDRTFTKIKKVVSGQDDATLEIVASVYESVVTAGVFKASSIKVAEAAKVIENTQRDVNIALMNELALIFNRMGIDTLDVLEAASTKWNFVNFRPGLVGGHCIGVDPYYLTHQAEKFGYIPQVILAGRRINDGMGAYIAQHTVKMLIQTGHHLENTSITIMGLTFKENCPDLRNSKVFDIIEELHSYGIKVQVCDPEAHAAEALSEYGVTLIPIDELPQSAAIILAVSHKEFKALPIEKYADLLEENGVLIDVKGSLDHKAITTKKINYWRL